MLLPLPQSALVLAALTVLTLGGPLTAYELPAISIMTDAIERIGAALAFGSMLFNLAWAIGETIGAPAAASLSRATSDAVPLAATGGGDAGDAPSGAAGAPTGAGDQLDVGTVRWSRPAADRRASRRESRRR